MALPERAVIYDSGMLIKLAKGEPRAEFEHGRIVRSGRPIVPGPALSLAWRDSPSLKAQLSRVLRESTVHVAYDEHDYKRIGVMLGRVSPPGRKRPDFVDALVAYTATGHEPAAVMTSDSADILAYLDALPRSRVLVTPV
jgi:hypothetical protein